MAKPPKGAAFPTPAGRLYGFSTSKASSACFPSGDSPVVWFYCPTACGGKVVAPATKGGRISHARRAVVRFFNEQSEFGLFSLGRSPVVKVLLSHRFSGREGGGEATKGGRIFLARKGGCTVFQRAKRVRLVFPRATARLYGFIVPPLAEGKVVAKLPKGAAFPSPDRAVVRFY